jgi:hypothetical protein
VEEDELSMLNLQASSPFLHSSQSMMDMETREVDDIAAQEEMELQELLALEESQHQMQDADADPQNQHAEPNFDHLETSDYDDDDYDAIFTEFITETPKSNAIIPDHDMDLSFG